MSNTYKLRRPSRQDWKARRDPSGENCGLSSAPGQSVSRTTCSSFAELSRDATAQPETIGSNPDRAGRPTAPGSYSVGGPAIEISGSWTFVKRRSRTSHDYPELPALSTVPIQTPKIPKVAMVKSEATVRFGAFEFDPDLLELRQDGVLVHLQPQPAQVLALLLATPGRLVTRRFTAVRSETSRGPTAGSSSASSKAASSRSRKVTPS